jgi:hypothetical protein
LGRPQTAHPAAGKRLNLWNFILTASTSCATNSTADVSDWRRAGLAVPGVSPRVQRCGHWYRCKVHDQGREARQRLDATL